MRKWILFGALILGLAGLEQGLTQWADELVGDSTSSPTLMDSPYPMPTPVPPPG